MAPHLRQRDHTLLDVCCGTGQLALHFAQQGYRVVGLDLSEHMLAHARRTLGSFVEGGQVTFVQADAAGFELDERFGLIVSTFDALNHLPDRDALRSCFASVYAVTAPGGTFCFDLNTRAGMRRWLGISVVEDADSLIINRGLIDEERDRAWTRISGFIEAENGLYERFEITAYNTIFDMAWVRDALEETGWRDVYFAAGDDLACPVEDPEALPRAFVVARRSAPGAGREERDE